jgi:hypothetical protein
MKLSLKGQKLNKVYFTSISIISLGFGASIFSGASAICIDLSLIISFSKNPLKIKNHRHLILLKVFIFT